MWPKPKTGKELASFLGLTGYYRSFIQNYAKLTAEMNSKKKEPLVKWTEDMEEKFKTLKQSFSRKPIRAYPRYGPTEEPFEVWPDWSNVAIGHLLQQVQDGQRRLIACGGRKNSKGETNYEPTKGECAAIVDALRRYEHILRYKKFVVRSDHQPLQWLHNLKNPRGIYMRWLAELASFDFEVQHVPGKETAAADALSRSKHLRDPTEEEIQEVEEYI